MRRSVVRRGALSTPEPRGRTRARGFGVSRNAEPRRSDRWVAPGRWLFHDAKHLVFTNDRVIDPIDLDLGSCVFGKQHAVASVHDQLSDRPIVEALSVADGDDLPFDRLLPSAVRDVDPALRSRFGVGPFDEYTVVEGGGTWTCRQTSGPIAGPSKRNARCVPSRMPRSVTHRAGAPPATCSNATAEPASSRWTTRSLRIDATPDASLTPMKTASWARERWSRCRQERLGRCTAVG